MILLPEQIKHQTLERDTYSIYGKDLIDTLAAYSEIVRELAEGGEPSYYDIWTGMRRCPFCRAARPSSLEGPRFTNEQHDKDCLYRRSVEIRGLNENYL